MRIFLYGVLAIGLLLAAGPAVAEVYKCEDPEGGIVFQQTPCPEPAPEADEADSARTEDTAPAAPAEQRRAVGRDESVADVVAQEQAQKRQSAEVEACKQQYRDAIDAIDVEIQNSYSPDQREYYLGRLKALTDKMSAC